jgi:hypothetical protein
MGRMSDMEIQDMSRHELIRRKQELEKLLAVFTSTIMDEVCREIGEIDYLLGTSG